MPDRLLIDRRVRSDPYEPSELERRRGDERRDSPRLALPITVLTPGRSTVHVAEVALGGVRFFTRRCSVTDDLMVRIRLPDRVLELPGRVSSVRSGERGLAVQIYFSNPPVLEELSLARWLHEKTLHERELRA